MKLDFSFLLEEVPTGESLKYIDWIVSGLQNTFYIFIIGFILSFAIGTILGILAVRESKIKLVVNYFLDIITSLPFIILVFFSYFVLPNYIPPLKNLTNEAVMLITGIGAIVVGMSSRVGVNVASGIKEFYKTEKSQIKNAEMFGLNPNKILREIVLPQVFKKIKSNLQNDSITIIKNTAVIGTIGFLDFSKQAQRIIDFTASTYEMFIVIIVIYVLLSFVSIFIFNLFFNLIFKRVFK